MSYSQSIEMTIDTTTTVKLYDIVGRELKAMTRNENGLYTLHPELLEDGLYRVEMTMQGIKEQYKVVIKNKKVIR